jgi:hypothetical protein
MARDDVRVRLGSYLIHFTSLATSTASQPTVSSLLSTMAHHVELPPLLLRLTSSPVTAVGLPIIVGMLSGLPTRRVVRGHWYNVRPPACRPPSPD